MDDFEYFILKSYNVLGLLALHRCQRLTNSNQHTPDLNGDIKFSSKYMHHLEYLFFCILSGTSIPFKISKVRKKSNILMMLLV